MKDPDRTQLTRDESRAYLHVVNVVGREAFPQIPWEHWPPANRDGPIAWGDDALRDLQAFWSEVDQKSAQADDLDIGSRNPLTDANMAHMLSAEEVRSRIDEVRQGDLSPYLTIDGFILDAALALYDQDWRRAAECLEAGIAEAESYRAAEARQLENDPDARKVGEAPLPWLEQPQPADWWNDSPTRPTEPRPEDDRDEPTAARGDR